VNKSELDPAELALVNRFVREQDEQLFRAIYRAHTPALYLFVMRILGNKHQDAEDVVQETWIRAVSKFKDFRGQSKLRTWLCGIALNCCRELMRNRNRADEHKIVTLKVVHTTFELEECIRALPNSCREVLVLHDIEGYTHTEIAEAMGISEGTSKSQLSRARTLLKDALHPTRRIHER
jgi:RNA polymerase sigma-70 factor (ECF subfamily)